jgi:exodeoxyribonuclease VII large subunit
LDARFNPVTVVGELSGFTRAVSGHCYFSLKDASGQMRCAMFRRAASLLDFSPKDGELVEVRGRLGVYEPRGELQLVVESLIKAGQGTLFEQFLQIKAKLEAEGLFDTGRKRVSTLMPRSIGVVSSPGAAAWHDVMTTLRRRVPHIPVVLAPSSVQGSNAPVELVLALQSIYAFVDSGAPVDVILLVRGGGAMEDLWAFNNEALARCIATSPVPVIVGVGHETDFTIADFVADLRAPTPTAAAEMAGEALAESLDHLEEWALRVYKSARRCLDHQAQFLDRMGAQIARPSGLISERTAHLARIEKILVYANLRRFQKVSSQLQSAAEILPRMAAGALQAKCSSFDQMRMRITALDPSLVLKRGYAWLEGDSGQPLVSVGQLNSEQRVTAILGDGAVDMLVTGVRPN